MKHFLMTLAFLMAAPAATAAPQQENDQMSQVNAVNAETEQEQATETERPERKKRSAAAIPTNKPKVATATNYDPWSKLGASGSELVNAEAGWDYRYTPTKDYPPDGRALDEWRNRLAARGFEPRNGPRATESGNEFHLSEPTAEIWRRPVALQEEEWRVKLADLVMRPGYAEHYKAYPGAVPALPIELRDAMFAFHNKKLPPAKRPTVADIRALCREVPVHPGVSPKAKRWG